MVCACSCIREALKLYFNVWLSQCLSSLLSKENTVGALIICSVRLFQGSVTLTGNENLRQSRRARSLYNFRLCPLVSLPPLSLSRPSVTSLSYLPVSILKVSIMSPLKGTPSIPETYLLSSVAWGLNLRVGWWQQILKKCKFSNRSSGRIVPINGHCNIIQACRSCSRALDAVPGIPQSSKV